MFKDHLIFSNNIYDAAKQILEAQKPIKRKTEKVIVTDAETPEGEYIPVIQGYYASGKGSKRGRQVEFDPGNAIPKETKQSEVHDAVQFADGDADANNIYTTGKPIEVLRSSIATFKHLDNVDPRTREIRRHPQLKRNSPPPNPGRIM